MSEFIVDKRLSDRLKEIAIKHCSDYPNIEIAHELEQLYALDCALDGIKKACEDWSKFTKEIQRRYNIPENDLTLLWSEIQRKL